MKIKYENEFFTFTKSFGLKEVGEGLNKLEGLVC